MVLPIPTAVNVSWFPTNDICIGVVFPTLINPSVAVIIPAVTDVTDAIPPITSVEIPDDAT